MTILVLSALIFGSGAIGYTLGNIKAFDEYMDSEKKAKAFWREVERRGLKK